MLHYIALPTFGILLFSAAPEFGVHTSGSWHRPAHPGDEVALIYWIYGHKNDSFPWVVQFCAMNY